MSKEKNIKYANKEFYRIKDLNTGLYYLARHWSANDSLGVMRSKYPYSYTPPLRSYNLGMYFLELDNIGHFYPTKRGAEKMLSEFVQCSIHKRNTQAGRILNSKFNFIVVKSVMKVKDVKE